MSRDMSHTNKQPHICIIEIYFVILYHTYLTYSIPYHLIYTTRQDKSRAEQGGEREKLIHGWIMSISISIYGNGIRQRHYCRIRLGPNMHVSRFNSIHSPTSTLISSLDIYKMVILIEVETNL